MQSSVEHCWLLDLDRTISSVEVVMEAVDHVCEQIGLDYAKINAQKELAEAGGHSFSVPVVVQSLWPEKYEQFCESLRLVEHLGSIYPDATQFINKLTETKQQFAIITYGDPRWQLLKLHFGGLDTIPYIICDIPEKNVLLEQYRVGDTFEIHTSRGVINTKAITLVDDKVAAFETPCSGVSGILIERRGRNVVPPPDVKLITTFNELTEEL